MQWLPAVAAVAAWPAGIVLMVLDVLVLVPRNSQVAVLAAIAEVIRAARGKSTTGSASPPTERAAMVSAQNAPTADVEAVVFNPDRVVLVPAADAPLVPRTTA